MTDARRNTGRRWFACTLILASALLVSCGGGGGGTPTPPSATLQSIAVTPTAFTPTPFNGGIGFGRQMVATGTYSDGHTSDLTASATWTSSATSVATVSGGVVTGVSLGTVTITATVGGVSGSDSVPITSNSWSPAANVAKNGNLLGLSGLTATTLTNGTVLVSGEGVDHGPNEAVLYSPVPDTWTAPGPMPTAVTPGDATATLLQDGRVLIVGGIEDVIVLSSVALYDPTTKTWSAAASLPEPRTLHAAALLANGQVLIVGGQTDSTSPVPLHAELYDPAANTWTDAGAMIAPSVLSTATRLANGKVFVVDGDALGTTEIYDPTSKSWTAGPKSANPHQLGTTATLLPDGRVLVVGGIAQTGANPTLSFPEIYDPIGGAWSSAGTMANNRVSHTATLLPSGNVLVAGGTGPSGPLSAAELYNPATNTWSSAGNMVHARSGAAAALMPGGEVLMVGGDGLWTAELYW
jgi:hypothetical protein